MTIFSTENLYKAYKDKVLFENLSFGMQEGERVGIIGKNGAGKSTLLKILSGLDAPDTGNVVFNKAIKTIFLDQMPEYNSEESILDNVLQSNERVYHLLEEHHKTCKEIESHFSSSLSEKLDKLNMEIDSLEGWNFENEAKKMLTMLGIEDYTKKVNHLSGGQKKRVAIAKALVAKPDFLILDEPTNHLDAESVQWLQDTLQSGNFSILFVTHDRYFLDALATKIIELDKKNVKHFPGNYEDYLITKAEQEAVEESTRQHIISKLRDEMEWLSRGVKARRTKQKSRIDWIDDLKGQTKKSDTKELKMEIGKVFLGSRIIDAYNISKEIGGKVLFRNFTYNAKPGDRIGIIGPNGSGKSTLMKIFCGVMETDSGSVKLGTSVKFGYFDQHVSGLNEDSSIIGVIREIGDYINVGVGKELKITARELLERFIFPSFMHSQLVRTLSGGEKRRLMLCRMLMANPNVLLLDEPTNDFDIQTLNALEEYLDYFKGTLISISHDRAFLDRTAEFIWAFDAKGNIKEYPGNYSNYLEKVELERQAANRIIKEEKKAAPKEVKSEVKKKLSFKEQRELEQLENELPTLEEEKMNLELKLNSFSGADYEKLQTLQKEYDELLQNIEEKEFRWLELSDN